MRLLIYSMPVMAVALIVATTTINIYEAESSNSTIPPCAEAKAITKATEERYFKRTGERLIRPRSSSGTKAARCYNDGQSL